MNSAYQWWLLALVVAGVIGAVWLMRGALPRRDVDITDEEQPIEAGWIADELRLGGHAVDADDVERVLELHRRYLDEPPIGAPDSPALVAPPATVEPPGPETSTDEGDARPASHRAFRRARYRARYGATRSSS